MDFYTLDFYGLTRQLPITHISRTKKIANFNILGDVELTEKAGELLEKRLRDQKLIPDCFVGPEVKIVPFIHHMAKRFGHTRYVILRKSIRGYMISPLIHEPNSHIPKHVKKLVLNGADQHFLKSKGVVLIDDVVSTGQTMRLLEQMMAIVGAKVLTKCAIFKQGEEMHTGVMTLGTLPIFDIENTT